LLYETLIGGHNGQGFGTWVYCYYIGV